MKFYTPAGWWTRCEAWQVIIVIFYYCHAGVDKQPSTMASQMIPQRYNWLTRRTNILFKCSVMANEQLRLLLSSPAREAKLSLSLWQRQVQRLLKLSSFKIWPRLQRFLSLQPNLKQSQCYYDYFNICIAWEFGVLLYVPRAMDCRWELAVDVHPYRWVL